MLIAFIKKFKKNFKNYKEAVLHILSNGKYKKQFNIDSCIAFG